MLATAHNFYQTKDLLFAWTGRNIRARYQQSLLGWLWAVVQPAASVLIFSVIFTWIVPVDTEGTPYLIFSYVAVVPWTLLATSLTDMTTAIVYNMDLVFKIYFPREALPIAAMLARLMDFGVAATLVAFLMLFYQIPVSTSALAFLPLILLIQLLLITGLGLAFAAMNVFYRDVQAVIGLGIQLWFYASPIIYPVSLVPEWLRPFYYINPMTGILEAYRDVILDGQMPGSYLAVSGGLSLIIFIFGYWFFKKVEFQFADIV